MKAGDHARGLMITVGAIALIGLIDAATGRNWDLVVVFGASIVLTAAAAVRLSVTRRSIGIRDDLARWLEDRAAAGDEPVERVADRAVAAYRSGLTSENDPA